MRNVVGVDILRTWGLKSKAEVLFSETESTGGGRARRHTELESTGWSSTPGTRMAAHGHRNCSPGGFEVVFRLPWESDRHVVHQHTSRPCVHRHIRDKF